MKTKTQSVSPLIIRVYASGAAMAWGVCAIIYTLMFLPLWVLIPAGILYACALLATKIYITKLYSVVWSISETEKEAIEFATEIIHKHTIVHDNVH